MTFQVFIGGLDVTDLVEQLTYSSTDPGGFEACTIEPRSSARSKGIRSGQQIFVMYGGEFAWMGLVNEAGDDSDNGQRHQAITGVGPGVKLRDNPYPMIYVDADFSKWGPPSRTRERELISTPRDLGDSEILPDVTTGLPTFKQHKKGPWSNILQDERFYDSGQGNTIAKIYYDCQVTSTISLVDANWQITLGVQDKDNSDAGVVNVNSGNIRANPIPPAYFTPTIPNRWAVLTFIYAAASASTSDYALYWRNLRLYGDHRMKPRGPDPGGLYPGDIAGDALLRSGAGFTPIIGDSSSYIVPHCVYRDPTQPEQIIDEQAKAMAWHYGTWEPTNHISTLPTFRFEQRPTTATAWVHRAQCDTLRAPTIKYDAIYDKAIVRYADPAGSSGFATVVLPSPFIDGVAGKRVLEIDLGPGSAAAAEAYGTFALRLAQAAARGGGSATLPANVGAPGGGQRPACLLRAGRDRLRIIDVSPAMSALAEDSRALDSFRVTRVETTVSQSGIPQTRVDFDGGVDLLEVLQARLATASVLAGV